MKQQFIKFDDKAGNLRLAYCEWGAQSPDRPTILCVHGLTRNARDFDYLAKRLSDKAHVICLDVAGRGQSSWLTAAKDYHVGIYAQHIDFFLKALDLHEVSWIGTSMGGLIAMAMAGDPRIKKLVINDVGPFVPQAALEQIKSYLKNDVVFDSLHELEQYLREIHAPFGELSDEQWAHMAEHGHRMSDGKYRLHYDPAIRSALVDQPLSDVDLWPFYEKISCPVMVLRGENSELLDPETAARMKKMGARLEVIKGAGHAPALMDELTADLIAGFLFST